MILRWVANTNCICLFGLRVQAAIHASPHNDSASLSPSMRRRAASEIQNAASDDDVEDQVQHLDERPSEEEQEDVDNSLSMDQDDEIEEDAKMGHVEPPAMLGTPMAVSDFSRGFLFPNLRPVPNDEYSFVCTSLAQLPPDSTLLKLNRLDRMAPCDSRLGGSPSARSLDRLFDSREHRLNKRNKRRLSTSHEEWSRVCMLKSHWK